MVQRFIFDAATLVQDTATIAATTASAAFAHPLVPSHYLNDAHHHTVNVNFRVDANTGGAAIEATVEVDDNSGFSAPVKVGGVAIVGTGDFQVPLDLATVKKLKAGATHLRVKPVITGGTTPSLTYSAFLARPQCG